MSLIAELKRRNVFRVGVVYAIVAWLLIQVADVALPTFEAPEWVMRVFTFLVILGFPLALIFAWAFELTPEGLKREKEVDPAESITHLTGRKLDFAIIGLMAVVLVAVAGWPLLQKQEVPASDGRTLVVLPLENLGAPENEYFADGITEELALRLGGIRALNVIGRTSSLQYKNTDKSTAEIGDELRVDYVVDGSVRWQRE